MGCKSGKAGLGGWAWWAMVHLIICAIANYKDYISVIT